MKQHIQERRICKENGSAMIEIALLLLLIMTIAIPSIRSLGKEVEYTIACDTIVHGFQEGEGLPEDEFSLEDRDYLLSLCVASDEESGFGAPNG